MVKQYCYSFVNNALSLFHSLVSTTNSPCHIKPKKQLLHLKEKGLQSNFWQCVCAGCCLTNITLSIQALRKQYRYMSHLPLTCEFVICELDIKPPVVSRETLNFFRGEGHFNNKLSEGSFVQFSSAKNTCFVLYWLLLSFIQGNCSTENSSDKRSWGWKRRESIKLPPVVVLLTALLDMPVSMNYCITLTKSGLNVTQLCSSLR